MDYEADEEYIDTKDIELVNDSFDPNFEPTEEGIILFLP
jgi:hypothetical protein